MKQLDGEVQATVARLRSAGCVMPEAEVAAALAAWHDQARTAVVGRLADFAGRRERGEPPAYILGGITFLRRWVRVGPGAFIPRPWTEAVALAAIELLGQGGTVVDVGTGAGAIALSIATASPASRIWATEVDPGALRWARENLDSLANVTVLEGDLLAPLPSELRGRVDLVAGCLPYVPDSALGELPRDFLDHEPRAAFDGGVKGLGLVGRALAEAVGWLRPGGWIVLEIGAGQGPGAVAAGRRLGYRDVTARQDDDGDDAMVVARRRA